jgi:hypothetical protein
LSNSSVNFVAVIKRSSAGQESALAAINGTKREGKGGKSEGEHARRSTAAAFPRYLTGEVVADSIALQWTGLYARRWRLPRVVDHFLVPATPEPHISCNLRGIAEFRERHVGGEWLTRQIRGGDMFVTRSRTPYEIDFESWPRRPH